MICFIDQWFQSHPFAVFCLFLFVVVFFLFSENQLHRFLHHWIPSNRAEAAQWQCFDRNSLC